MTKYTDYLQWAWAGVLAVWGCTHLIATSIWLLPACPLTEAVMPIVDGYMQTAFVQNWHFFAPTPGLVTSSVSITCTFDDGTDTKIDPTRRLVEKGELNFSPSLQKVLYLHRQVAESLTGVVGRAVASDCNGAVSSGDTQHVCDRARDRVSKSTAYGRALRYGLDHCRMQRAGRIEALQITLVQRRPIAFSRLGSVQTAPETFLRFREECLL